MSLVQLVMIWGAAQAALFSFPAQAGEWESYKALKEAIIRSSARRDVPLPPWVAGLDYQRSNHFYDLNVLKKEKRDDIPSHSPAAVVDSVVKSSESR